MLRAPFFKRDMSDTSLTRQPQDVAYSILSRCILSATFLLFSTLVVGCDGGLQDVACTDGSQCAANERCVEGICVTTAEGDTSEPLPDADTDPGDADTDPEPSDADTDPGDADTDPGDADTDPEPSDADTDPGDADTDPGDADTDPGDADTDPGDADTDPGDADTDPSDADTDPGDTDSAACAPGEIGCTAAGRPYVCTDGEIEELGPCVDTAVCNNGTCEHVDTCIPDSVVGCADVLREYVCAADGVTFEARACDNDHRCLSEGDGATGACRPVDCVVDERTCSDDRSAVLGCDLETFGHVTLDVCPLDDLLRCDDGVCVRPACPMSGRGGGAHVGCTFWATDMPIYETFGTSVQPTRARIANRGTAATPVRFAPSWLETRHSVLLAGGVATSVPLPSRQPLGTGRSRASVEIGALTPVQVVQSRGNVRVDGEVTSMGASLLLSEDALGTDYVVLGWTAGSPSPLPGGDPGARHAYFSVVGTVDRSSVAILFGDPPVSNPADEEFADLRANTEYTFTLNRGEVLHFRYASLGTDLPGDPIVPRDPTGTLISATDPVAVFVGHEGALIGTPRDGSDASRPCCEDHLQMQLWPATFAGTDFVLAVGPRHEDAPDLVRVLALDQRTSLTIQRFDSAAVETTLLDAYESLDISLTDGATVEATHPVMVAQFTIGQMFGDGSDIVGTGDPSMTPITPVDRFLASYRVDVDEGEAVTATIVAGVDEHVQLNGFTIPAGQWTTTRGWRYARITLTHGVHEFSSAAPFGLTLHETLSEAMMAWPAGVASDP